MGITGVAVARFLCSRGAKVTLCDSAPEGMLLPSIKELSGLPVNMETGGINTGTCISSDMVIVSPGVPLDSEAVVSAKNAGVLVIGELELAASFIRVPVIAVTGTNGKTTVCRLVARMLEASGKRVFLGGNIGTPLVSCLDNTSAYDFVVAEVSSFQLESIKEFRPHVGAILNITPDHLDRYSSMESYAAAKSRIFENQGKNDFAVVNARDPLAVRFTERILSRRFFFNLDSPASEGSWINESGVRIKTENKVISIPAEKIGLRGRHNLENVAAAAVCTLISGGTEKGVINGLEGFRADPHRLETVALIRGVEWIDDSKATNVDAVRRALEAVGESTILIMGGRDKMGGYDTLIPVCSRYIKRLIVMGEAAGGIANTLGGYVDCEIASDMADAVKKAASCAGPGDKVLLSPGCSSFDMYQNYVQRGIDFQKQVRRLA